MAYGAPYIIRDLAHDEWHEGEFFTALAMIQHVSLSGTAVNLKSLTMVGMEWAMLFGKKDTEYGSCSNSLLLGAFIQRCKILQTLPCKALKFFRCIVSLCFVFPDDNYERIQLIANIFDAKIDLSIGEFGSAFWNVLESSVCAPDIGKVQMLKDWLRWVVAHQDMENDHSPPPWSRLSDNRPRRLFRIVQKILREIQSSDPRSPAHQRNSKWCLDDVRHLDTHSLSRITIRVLIELADENPEKDTSVTSIANAESCGSYSRTPSP
ncbi:uncharacterized protein LOC129583238 isoform X2 [Paramacrobiotus metropolitanus]|nr:uncharacterized protein LOC129583238 isoform X2 [Paramacrobiotus metropolitanus]